jgi:hypothetical protein
MLVRGEMLCACSVSAQRKASKQLHNACALCMCICVCASIFCEIYAVSLAMRRRLFTALSMLVLAHLVICHTRAT